MPSTPSICDNVMCKFTDSCDKIGKDILDFNVELVDGVGSGSKFLEITSDTLWVNGDFLLSGKEDECYLRVFNLGDPAQGAINKDNTWVFGKFVLE